MTVRAVIWHQPGSRGWHAQRTNPVRLGGSEVAAALGLSPWESPFSLWHRKAGRLGPVEENEPMRWGNLLEPVVLAEWCRRTDTRPSRRPRVWADDWRIASPDCITTRDGIVEAKTADDNTTWQWGPDGSDAPDAVPLHYRVQVLWYVDVVPRVRPEATLVVLIGGNDLRSYTIRPEPGEIDDIRDRARRYHATILAGTPPALDSSVHTYEAVRALNPDVDGSVDLPAAPVEEWAAADAALTAAAEARNLARTVVADLMGAARYGYVDGVKRTRRESRNGGRPYPVLVRPRAPRGPA